MTAILSAILFLKFGFHMAQFCLRVCMAQSATGRWSIKYGRSMLLCRKEQGIVLQQLGTSAVENGAG